MFTPKERKKIENLLAAEIKKSGISDYSLRVARSNNAPDTMSEITVVIELDDMPKNRKMIHLSDTLLRNIFCEAGVRPCTLGMVATTVFKDSVHWDTFVHLVRKT